MLSGIRTHNITLTLAIYNNLPRHNNLNTWIRGKLVRGYMVFNATFNNISAISWRSGLLVEETGVPGENHRPATSNRPTLSHNVFSLWTGFELTTLVVTDTDCTDSCKSNDHTITTRKIHVKYYHRPLHCTKNNKYNTCNNFRFSFISN